LEAVEKSCKNTLVMTTSNLDDLHTLFSEKEVGVLTQTLITPYALSVSTRVIRTGFMARSELLSVTALTCRNTHWGCSSVLATFEISFWPRGLSH